MMISFPENIKPILEAVIELNPKSVLDVGCGFGKYGLMIREALMSDRAEKGDLIPQDDIYIAGSETANYFLQGKNFERLTAIYDSVHFSLLDVERYEKPYDLIILIDVVEHWTKEEALKFMKYAKASGAKILVSTPKNVHMYTEHYYGEDCPRHQTQWCANDFLLLGGKDISTEQSFIFIL